MKDFETEERPLTFASSPTFNTKVSICSDSWYWKSDSSVTISYIHNGRTKLNTYSILVSVYLI